MGSIYGMQLKEKLRQRLAEMGERRRAEGAMRRAQQAREKAAYRESYQQARISRARTRGREAAKGMGFGPFTLRSAPTLVSRGRYRSYRRRAPRTRMGTGVRAARPRQLQAPQFQPKRFKFAWEQ